MMQNYTIYAYILYTLYIYCTADIIIFPLVPGGPLYNTSPPPNIVLLFYEMIFPLILVVVGSDRGGGWGLGDDLWGGGIRHPACLPALKSLAHGGAFLSSVVGNRATLTSLEWAIGLHQHLQSGQ